MTLYPRPEMTGPGLRAAVADLQVACPDMTDTEGAHLARLGVSGYPAHDGAYTVRDLLAVYRAAVGEGPGGRLPTGDVLAALTGGAATEVADQAVTTEIGDRADG